MKKGTKIALIVIICVVAIGGLCAYGLFQGIKYFQGSDFKQDADKMFGDQRLKTAVAVIELHKIRYGKYPKNLSELKYLGNWDQLITDAVTYSTNDDQSAYYVEVRIGWAGKPELLMPAEFWQGTGFDPSLKPAP